MTFIVGLAPVQATLSLLGYSRVRKSTVTVQSRDPAPTLLASFKHSRVEQRKWLSMNEPGLPRALIILIPSWMNVARNLTTGRSD